MRIRKPAANGDGMLRVENIGSWGVVNDDGVFEVPPNLREIFDVVSLVVVATLPEESVMNHFVDIKLIQ